MLTQDNLLVRMKDEEWDSVLSTNLTSIYKLSKSVLRSMMKSRYGKIINISSVVGHMGNAGQTNYVASKAGITGFTKSLAQEVGNRGITVNCVAPGFIDTDMTKSLSDEQKEFVLGVTASAKKNVEAFIDAVYRVSNEEIMSMDAIVGVDYLQCYVSESILLGLDANGPPPFREEIV